MDLYLRISFVKQFHRNSKMKNSKWKRLYTPYYRISTQVNDHETIIAEGARAIFQTQRQSVPIVSLVHSQVDVVRTTVSLFV